MTQPGILVLAFPEAAAQAAPLAEALGCPLQTIGLHRFPDGESLVTLPASLPDTLVVFRSLHQPNTKLVELLLATASARRNGCTRIVLVAPYLCYMRQDKAFVPGQVVSQQVLGEQLSLWVDDLITVDPHLHRIQRLEEALPYCNSIALSAAPLLGEHLRDAGIKALLVGPDEESRQWVQQVATISGNPYVVASKQRSGDRQVQVSLPPSQYQGVNAILVDDVISSGKTMMEAARQLRAAGARSVSALCTHALFAPGAEDGLCEAGIDSLWSSDAIPHASNRISLAAALAQAVRDSLSKPAPPRHQSSPFSSQR